MYAIYFFSQPSPFYNIFFLLLQVSPLLRIGLGFARDLKVKAISNVLFS